MRASLTWTVLACALGFLAVAFGAFGAHALRDRLNPQDLAIFETAVRYQFYHAFALAACDVVLALGGVASAKLVRAAGLAFSLGIALFCGSLYILVLSGVRRWGMVTPLGGLAFLIGWASLGMAAWKARRGT